MLRVSCDLFLDSYVEIAGELTDLFAVVFFEVRIDAYGWAKQDVHEQQNDEGNE